MYGHQGISAPAFIKYNKKKETLENTCRRAFREHPGEPFYVLTPTEAPNFKGIKLDDTKRIRLIQHTIEQPTQIVKVNGEDKECRSKGIVRVETDSKTFRQMTFKQFQEIETGTGEDWEAVLDDLLNPQDGKKDLYYGINIDNNAQDFIDGIDHDTVYDISQFQGDLLKCFDLPPADSKAGKRNCQGTLISSLYFGSRGSPFPGHVEDAYLESINLSYQGYKLWYGPKYAKDTKRFFEIMDRLGGRKCKSPCNKKEFFMDPREMVKHGIPIVMYIQRPGDIILTSAFRPHAGFNFGRNINEAKNCLITEDYMSIVPHLINSECDRKSNGCFPQNHLTDLGIERICQTLAGDENWIKFKTGVICDFTFLNNSSAVAGDEADVEMVAVEPVKEAEGAVDRIEELNIPEDLTDELTEAQEDISDDPVNDDEVEVSGLKEETDRDTTKTDEKPHSSAQRIIVKTKTINNFYDMDITDDLLKEIEEKTVIKLPELCLVCKQIYPESNIRRHRIMEQNHAKLREQGQKVKRLPTKPKKDGTKMEPKMKKV